MTGRPMNYPRATDHHYPAPRIPVRGVSLGRERILIFRVLLGDVARLKRINKTARHITGETSAKLGATRVSNDFSVISRTKRRCSMARLFEAEIARQGLIVETNSRRNYARRRRGKIYAAKGEKKLGIDRGKLVPLAARSRRSNFWVRVFIISRYYRASRSTTVPQPFHGRSIATQRPREVVSEINVAAKRRTPKVIKPSVSSHFYFLGPPFFLSIPPSNLPFLLILALKARASRRGPRALHIIRAWNFFVGGGRVAER